MKAISVSMLNESAASPAGMMTFLGRLTQRGHNIKSMDDLWTLYDMAMENHHSAHIMASLPHGTIKRFTPITIAIVGASRRFLAQARTHQVGMNYVSASLQYSDYSNDADFVVPYELLDKCEQQGMYLQTCKRSMEVYKHLVEGTNIFIDGSTATVSNDTAGYVAPQGLRNILIMQGNHEAWMHFIRTRGCNRNTLETQYVTLLIWEELLKSTDGRTMFKWAGPDCCYGKCREGFMACGQHLGSVTAMADTVDTSLPRLIIEAKFPLLKGV